MIIAIIKSLPHQLLTSTTTVDNFRDVGLKPATSDTRRLTISLHPSRYVISSGNSRSKFGITCKNEDNKPLPQKQIHNVD